MPNRDASSFDPALFQPIRLFVRFKNLVSDTEVTPDLVQLIELGELSLVFEVPQKVCSQGHSILITIWETKRNPDATFKILEATGKVVSSEPLEEGRLRAELQLLQYEHEDLQKLHFLFNQRQDEISEFLNRTRD